MRVSEDRVRQIADRIVEVLLDDELLEWEAKLEALTVKVEKVILEDLAFEDRVTQEAEAKLQTYSREITPGTAEWMILMDKTKDETAAKYGYVIR